ncbi:AI-2E family transporter [Parabacteroides sp. ZJ-118]|uniref:AI-2E family transporter n=1 Tax=Parabacteroides sp. ZJ-118 TaxID=2709398 RepID=UPI0013EE1DE9|nr:AI-2E family transporter [Parabacteroides sp. ZJ-118]
MYMGNVKEQYWKYALITILLGLGVLLFFKIIPFLGGILGAITLYLLLRGQLRYLTERRRMRPLFAALLLLGETVVCFLVPFTLSVWLVVSKIQDIRVDPALLLDAGQRMADLVREKTGFDALGSENLARAAAMLPRIGQFLVGSLGRFAVNVIVLIFILYFMLMGGRRMENYLYTLFPFNDPNKDEVLNEIRTIVKSNAIGIPLLAVIQGVVAMAGYFIFRAPDPLLFGFLTCIATVIPLVGTALVWVPLAAYLALTGDWVHAAGLTLYALLVITNADNLIRFILQKRLADIHPLVTVIGVVIGLSLFGFMGIIFGPLLVSLFLLCLDIFKKRYLDP